VFENRVLRRVFGSRRYEMTGHWRKLHIEGLQNWNSSPSVIRTMKSRGMRWTGYMPRIGEKNNLYSLLLRKPEGKRPLGTPDTSW
jgi:hypothetical protein